MEEPAENIGVSSAESMVPRAAEPTTRAERFVARLGHRYWRKSYGGGDAFETLVRTVLSQNTADTASQPAHDALLDRYAAGGPCDEGDLVASLAHADRDRLAETIAAAGLYNQKSRRLVTIAERVRATYGDNEGFDRFVKRESAETVREELLAYPGVGPKTADCVLLFAGGRAGVFPVDTHVHRVARRLGLASPDADHEAVREALERQVPPEQCGFAHTATIQFGRDVCSARAPACLDDPDACPMADICEQRGVFPDRGEVVDPSGAE